MRGETPIRTVTPGHPREEQVMAKASSTTADQVKDFGVALDRSSELDGFTVNFVTITKSHDLAPILASLPTGKCTCPHWGYVTKGRVVVRYDDHEEILGPGDAFYMAPGHAPEDLLMVVVEIGRAHV